ncbi:hypothetical protein ACFOOP_09405 [Marinicaulis aureus]|uniref:Uncharacterized protein n=1 Tax=Hyphococcus aureus TaxID=2666033 RepID=A0ABW1KTQ9_9PROT
MRIISGSDQELYIITPDNNVCSFVGQKPARANPLHDAAPRPARETIADAFMSACANFAGNLQRGAFRN